MMNEAGNEIDKATQEVADLTEDLVNEGAKVIENPDVYVNDIAN